MVIWKNEQTREMCDCLAALRPTLYTYFYLCVYVCIMYILQLYFDNSLNRFRKMIYCGFCIFHPSGEKVAVYLCPRIRKGSYLVTLLSVHSHRTLKPTGVYTRLYAPYIELNLHMTNFFANGVLPSLVSISFSSYRPLKMMAESR